MIINAKNNATKPNKEKMIKEGLLTIAMLASMPVMAQKTSTAVLHPDQAKEKINKEIYGQFAEHLGTCIYGGLWVGTERHLRIPPQCVFHDSAEGCRE